VAYNGQPPLFYFFGLGQPGQGPFIPNPANDDIENTGDQNGEEINLELNLNLDARPATTPEHENEAPPVQDHMIIVLNLVPTVEQDDLMEPVQQEDLMAMNTMAQ
jgi:hypothetical protein